MHQKPVPAFLDPKTLALGGTEAGLDVAALQPLLDLARRIASDAQLQDFISTAHHTVFSTNTDATLAVGAAKRALGDDGDLLPALFVLDSLRLVHARHAARGAPSESARAVNHRHGGSWLRDAATRGDLGSVWWHPGWLRTV